MKKILFILLCTVSMYGQVSTGQEQEFDYGIKNNSSQTVTSTVNLVTEGVDGTYGKIALDINSKSFLSTGLIKNGLISINADATKFNISAGIGIISNFDNPENPISTIVNFPSFTGVIPTYLTTGNITYVAINSTPVLVMQATPFTESQRRDLIILGAVVHSNFTTINVVNNISAPSNAVGNQLHDFIEAVGALNISGNKYTANGANLQLNKSAGTIFKMGSNFANDWKNPHEITQSAGTSLSFRYRTQNGTEGSDRINLDPALYDLNNVLTAVPNNKFTIQTVVMFQTGLTRILYGQSVYNDLNSAKNAIFTRNFNMELNSKENGVVRAYIIVKNTTTSLQNIADADILEAQKFGGVASGGVALTLANIVSALTFTPENVANKATTLTASSTLYPNNDAVIVALATKEDKVNKVTSIGSPANDTNYPSELAVKTYADNLVVGMLNDRGTWDASVNVFPTTGGSGIGGAIRKGDMWYASVAGTLGTKSVNVGDSFRALVNAPAQVAANWSILEANIGYVPANDANVVHLAGAETITGQKTFSPTISASGAIARGTYFTPKLSATANNDILVGLDINPTFTNGSFTGTTSLPVRVTSNQYIGMNVSRNSTGGSAITISNNNGGYNFGVGSINEFFIQRAGGNIVNTIFQTGNSIIQNGGTFTDDLTNRLQVTGTVSSGTTALGNTPPTANNQLTRKDYVDTGLALKANSASPALTGTPTAPTAPAGTNTTQIATTDFVQAGLNLKSNLSDITLQIAYDTSTDKKIQTLAIRPFTLKAQTAAASDNVFVIENSGGFAVASVGAQGKLWATSASVEGNVTGNFFIKRSSPINNILLAGGGDLAQGTAFNKNFGTTAGTVAEGNDSRINNGQTAFSWGNHAGLYSPLTGGTGYIQNQNASAQAANIRISGKAHFGDSYADNAWASYTSQLQVGQMIYQDFSTLPQGSLGFNNYFNGINNVYLNTGGAASIDWTNSGDMIFKTYQSGSSGDAVVGGVALTLANTGAATFSSSVTASPATLPNHVVVKSQLDAFVPSGTVNLTGDQTISGQKSFSLTGKIDMKTNNTSPAISVISLGSNGLTAAEFINNSSSPNSTALALQTSSSGGVGNRALDVLNMSPIGTGIFSNASNGGVSISSESHNGDSYISNITYGGTGRNYVGRNNGIETYSVDKTGKVTATSYTATSLPVFENNAAASSLTVGQFYRTSTGVLMVKF